MRVTRSRSKRNPEKEWRSNPLIPYGASTMSDDDFWGRVRETAALLDETRQLKGTGARSGQ